jgi:hypothetical protein
MKTIVFSWQQKCDNMPQTETTNFWGLGDGLKGIITTYQYCKRYNYKFVLDIHKHPISYFLKYSDNTHSILLDSTSVPFVQDVPRYITMNQHLDVIPIFSNSQQFETIDDDTKMLIRNILVLKDQFVNSSLNTKYKTFHFRLGDLNIRQNNNIDHLFDHCINILRIHSNIGDYMCSDSFLFKQKVAGIFPNLNILNKDKQSGHVGYEIDLEKIKTTIDDLQLLTNSTCIYSFSIYGGLSAFADIIAKCFGIQIIKC